MSNWDADAAVALFLESGGGGGGQGGFSAAVGGQRARAGGNAGFGGSGFAAGDYDMDAGFDAAADDYRAPIEAKVERMVEHGPGAYRGGGPSVQAPVVHRAWRDVEGERKAARGQFMPIVLVVAVSSCVVGIACGCLCVTVVVSGIQRCEHV